MRFPAYLAEGISTFLLTLGVGGSLAVGFSLSTPLVASLILGVCVYIFGTLSGAHLNPAISIMLFVKQRLSLLDTVGYVVLQCVGAFLASLVLVTLYGEFSAPVAHEGSTIFLAEALGTLCLGLGVSSVARGNAHAGAAGLTVGGSLLVGILIAQPVSLAFLNPAVALGILGASSLNVTYVLAPIVGAAVAGLVYKGLHVGGGKKK